MRSIETLLDDAGFTPLLNPREFRNIKPWGADKLCDFIEDIKKSEESKVIIIPDADVDGILSAKEMLDTLMVLTPADISVYRHSYKMHGLSMPILYEILKNGCTHVVIVDSSTNDMEELTWLASKGIKILVIDHHNSNYALEEYPKEVLVLNNKMCLKEGIQVPYREVSCGALVALYCNYLYSYYGLAMSNMYWTYAMLTLYSDGMDLFDEFNVMLIAYARSVSVLDTTLRGLASKKEAGLNRELLTFSISPKINACLKANNFNPVLELFFDKDLTSKRQKELCTEINNFNGYIKDYMNTLEGTLLPTVCGSIGVVDMSTLINDEVIDFKGTIANRSAEQLGKLVIAYYTKGGTCYASVRDPYNRDVLSIFKEVCSADGHKSAFGFTVKESNLESLVRYVNLSLEEVTSTRKKPMIIAVEDYELTDCDIYNMSIINEYAVNNGVFLKVKVSPEQYKIENFRGMYSVKSSRLQLTGSIPVNYGDTVIAVPTLGLKSRIKIKTIVRS